MLTDAELLIVIENKLAPYDFPHANARMFKDLEPEQQEELNKEVEGLNLGYLLIFYKQLIEGWVLIACNAIAIKNTDKIDCIELKNIVSIQPNKAEINDKREQFDKYKFELTNWTITDSIGNSYLISIEKDTIYYSFYHVLQRILRELKYW